MESSLKRCLRAAAAALVLGSLSIVAQAAVSTFSSQAGFTSALTTFTTESFDAAPVSHSVGIESIAFADFTASVASGCGAFLSPCDKVWVLENPSDAADHWLSPMDHGGTLWFTDFSNVNGVGGFFFATRIDGSVWSGQSLLIKVVDGDGIHDYQLDNVTESTYFGVISSTWISAVGVVGLTVVDDGANRVFSTVDELTVGNNVSVVPEPESLALLLSGLGVVGFLSRRRDRN